MTEKKAPSKGGRPSKFTPELVEKLLADLRELGSLRKVCALSGMPAISTVMNWLSEEDKKEFLEQYARAREAYAEKAFDELDDLAEKALTADGAIEIAGIRVAAEIKRWRLSKLAPKKYGDKLEIENNVTIKPVPSFAQMYASDVEPGSS